MKSRRLKSVDEIHQILKEFRNNGDKKYRGQSNSQWKLIPKAGRKIFSETSDEEIFRHWKRRA